MSNKSHTRRPDKSKALRGGWREQWRYAWLNTLADMLRQPLATLLTVMVIAISLTLPSVCYLVYKNVSEAANQPIIVATNSSSKHSSQLKPCSVKLVPKTEATRETAPPSCQTIV